ncbi:MAG: hypothetical protein R6X32_06430 [Chloroflexota bacterium]
MLYPVIIFLTIGGIVAAMASYRGIRRGGARFYTLEREAMLRRASYTLLGALFFFVAAIGLLLHERQQLTAPEPELESAPEAVVENPPTPTATLAFESIPPANTPTPTPDPDQPTPTPTAVICRAQITDTGGNGLTMRTAPGGEEIVVLPEGSLVILLEDEPVSDGTFTWRYVRVTGGAEGWVAQEFLTIGSPCD